MPISRRSNLAVAFFTTFLFSTPNAFAIFGDCGQPASNGAAPKASDALTVLKVAVGQLTCEPCVCDLSGNGTITAPDALATLKLAVGQVVARNCPVCAPALLGFVRAPSAGPLLQVGLIDHASLVGTVVQPGATVSLYGLDAEGNVGPNPTSTVTADVNGKYKIRPVPTPGTNLAVCSTTPVGQLCGFVLSDRVDIDPIAEFLYGTSTQAVQSSPVGISALSLAEARAFQRLLDDADLDFAGAMSPADISNLINTKSGGIYAQLIEDFATSTSGPPVAVAGNYNLVQSDLSVERFNEPGSGETASVNSRSVRSDEFNATLSIGGDASVNFTSSISGQSMALNEVSGVITPAMGPNIVVNSNAEIAADTITETGPTGQTLLPDPQGQILLVSDSVVNIGQAAKGGAVAIVSSVENFAERGSRGLAFALREGSGLSNSSLSGTYNVVQYEVEFFVNASSGNVSRAVTVRNSNGTASFNGSGGFTIGAADGNYVRLSRSGPDSSASAAVPTVTFDSDNLVVVGPANSGLTYTLSSKGILEIREGSDVVAQGATAANGNTVILRFGGQDGDSFHLGFLVATKRGSGMNNGSGNGTFRSFALSMQLGHDFITGSVGGAPSQDLRMVEVGSEIGSFALDGNGVVTVFPSMSRRSFLHEQQSVFETAPGVFEIRDATTSISPGTEGSDSLDPMMGTYTISSTGTFVAEVGDEGSVSGILSPDGNVLVFGNGEVDGERGARDILIALRQP